MLKLDLKKPIVFFDVETTGLNVIRDRILQIALIKYMPGNPEPIELEMLINPSIPISNESMSIHGITPEMLKNEPTFKQVAEKLYDFIGDADLSGYNSDRFDIPMLMEEFGRAGYDFSLDFRRTIDVQKIFYKMEPRTLVAALKFYSGKKLENAHDALSDVRATIDVLNGQIDRYKDADYEDDDEINRTHKEHPIQPNVDALSSFTMDKRSVDVTQRLKINNQGEVVFNFGKYIGRPVGKTLAEDRQYFDWMTNKDFSIQVKRMIKKIRDEYIANQKKQELF